MPPPIPATLEGQNKAATLWRDIVRLFEDYNDREGFLKVVGMITSKLEGKSHPEPNVRITYEKAREINLDGNEIASLECSSGDSVRIYETDGSFILISPRLRDVHRPDEDLTIEVFPEGVNSVAQENQP